MACCKDIGSPIGGFFELELPHSSEYHVEGCKLNSARNCFEAFLISKKVKSIWMPYYSCEVMLEPIVRHNIAVNFYSVDNNLNPDFSNGIPSLTVGETFLYVNYFGLKSDVVSYLYGIFHKHLVIDNSQAFYDKPIANVPTIYSPRKFFGVPDGGYLMGCDFDAECCELDESATRMEHLLKRIECGAELSYSAFKENSRKLSNQHIKRMSRLTSRILLSIDYENVAKKRRENFLFLHDALGKQNILTMSFNSDTVPMVYPLLSEDEGLRDKLIANKIFVAMYWPNVINGEEIMPGYRPKATDRYMSKHIVALPIDQRYDISDMQRILDVIMKN